MSVHLRDEGKIVRGGERRPSLRPTISSARPATFSTVNELKEEGQ